MDITLIKLAVERLNQELETMKERVRLQEEEILRLKSSRIMETPTVVKSNEDRFIDTKEVQRILGVCYNTLQHIVQKGLLKPIRINQRKIRYSRSSVLQYLTVGG